MKPSPFAIETCAEPGWKKPQAARVHAFHPFSEFEQALCAAHFSRNNPSGIKSGILNTASW
ncbi:hypothetical protein [Ottowia cancrivicina]|uniref:Uncharacterized protein n=1 Tax=Ottowia cancrivicina TaxID=3040346 RepID=A0AAW6RJH9_9BURK|nr:hypothetical protein [Ottowia sp. 10c7w1]MDG9698761.1 hypothetical protein [Ottowia sp. 10c7w1]